MRNTLSLGLLCVVAVGAWVAGCSGSDATVGNGDGGDDGATDASTADGGGSGDGSTTDGAGGDGSNGDGGGGDGATGDSGSRDGGTSDGAAGDGGGGGDGGLVSDPGHVSCGSTSCMVPSEFCCVDYSVDGGSRMCAASGNLSACMRGTREACDEKANCTNGQVCCIELGQGFGETTRCMPTCITGALRYQACRTSAECENHQMCRLVTCPGNPPMGMCEVPPGCQ